MKRWQIAILVAAIFLLVPSVIDYLIPGVDWFTVGQALPIVLIIGYAGYRIVRAYRGAKPT
jgi:uncharacterized membrane protein YjjB (DUF3815 family)